MAMVAMTPLITLQVLGLVYRVKGGELGGKDAPCQLDKEYRPGVFMDVFAKLLEERHLSITFYTLDAENRPI